MLMIDPTNRDPDDLREHFTGKRNPPAFLKKRSMREVNATCEIIVCHTRNGTAAHGLDVDCKTVAGTWQELASVETLDRALVYLGATEEQMKEHRNTLRRWGQGSSHIALLPRRKNLLNIDRSKP
jgi:hypothetical protein